MSQKIKFLQTSAGDYGLAKTGDEMVVSNTVAAHLEKHGVAKVLGDAGDDAVSKPASTSVRFHDETGKANKPVGETDHKNPTGKDLPSKKPTPLKSAPKKK